MIEVLKERRGGKMEKWQYTKKLMAQNSPVKIKHGILYLARILCPTLEKKLK
jgi:hypothetical protein